jgi:hypothetical protein
VGAKRPAKDISQEPEMKQLKDVLKSMDREERARTIDYLKEE